MGGHIVCGRQVGGDLDGMDRGMDGKAREEDSYLGMFCKVVEAQEVLLLELLEVEQQHPSYFEQLLQPWKPNCSPCS